MNFVYLGRKYTLSGSYWCMSSRSYLSARVPLKKLPEDATKKIGPLYLKRLYFLHLGRLQTFRSLLVSPPHLHPETDKCDFADQKRLARAWALATAYLAWEARPGEWLRSARSVASAEIV